MSFCCLLLSTTAFADSWVVTQNVTTNSATTFSQQAGTGAIQAGNAIRLNSTNGKVSSANQSMTTSGNTLTLTQDASHSSHQAVNYLFANHLNSASQQVNNISTLSLTQNGGSGNVQALNQVLVTGTGTQIDTLNQSVSAESMLFQGTGSNNIQAGNYLQADSVSTTAGDVVQDFTVSGDVSYSLTGSNNVQAGNVVIKKTAAFTGQVTQNFSAGNVTASFSESDSNNSIKAANYFAVMP
jgi:hypothetical protein